MKTLLFAEWGGKAPRVVNGAKSADDAPMASRWWLVECETAEAGRSLVAAVDPYLPTGKAPTILQRNIYPISMEGMSGRILDSGSNTLAGGVR